MSGQKKTATDKKSGQEVAKNGQEQGNRYHVDYWRRRLFKKTYTWQGQRREVDEWSVRFQHLGHREAFALGTANATAAATKAKDIATFLEANGWEATRAKHKPDTVKKVKAPTVGEFLEAVRAVANIAPGTFGSYAQKFRNIVAGVEGIEAKKIERPKINDKTGLVQVSRKTGKPRTRMIDPRFDYVHGGAAAWRARIDAVPLDHITAEKIQRWVSRRLKAVSDNPAKLASARTSLNSVLRAGGSLFAPSIVRHLSHLNLPSPLPFDGVEKPTAPRRRYESRISVEILHGKAEAELRDATGTDKADCREMFAIYLLALFAGLRRDEIDTLTWGQIDFATGRVHIETNEHTAAKSDNSEGSVSLAPEVLAYLKAKHATRTDQFVIESAIRPKPSATSYHHYRCNRLFGRLILWLRTSAGVKARNPLHTLRKEFGSFIARKFGIFAASEALRHGDIRLTRDYYLASDNRATFGPSAFLNTGTTADTPAVTIR